MHAFSIKWLPKAWKKWLGRGLPLMLAVGLPHAAAAAVSANLTWIASSDPGVTGYDIYYGGASEQFTNQLSVGAVTNALIPGLAENTTYFFAAKAHDGAGNESDFSNETAFTGVTTTPQGKLTLRTLPKNFSSDPLRFSLDATAPAGATINPTNGVLSWTPGHAYAYTTNYLNVLVTDAANPALGLSETVMVVVGDYLEFQVGNVAVAAGQSGSLPITVAASGAATNLQLTLAWPGAQLLNPTLSFAAPIVAGSIRSQNGHLVVKLRTAASQPFTGAQQVAQVNFQAASGAVNTATYNIAATAPAGVVVGGSAFANPSAQAGAVVVVGSQPLLQPQSSPGAGRSLALYAMPGSYRLLYTTSLRAPVTWTPLLTYQQTNAVQNVSLDPTIPSIFYRLQQL